MNEPNPYDMDKRLTILESQQADIKEQLKGINQNMSKLVWLVLGAVVVGVVNMWSKGGLL